MRSRHTIELYDYGVTEGGLPYIVMEFLEGQSLDKLVSLAGKKSIEIGPALCAQASGPG